MSPKPILPLLCLVLAGCTAAATNTITGATSSADSTTTRMSVKVRPPLPPAPPQKLRVRVTLPGDSPNATPSGNAPVVPAPGPSGAGANG